MARYTLKDFQAQYPTDEACLDQIMVEQYGGTTIDCPGCGIVGAKFHRITKRRAFACQHCGHHIYPCVGTIFEKSRTNLTKWFYAMYLFTSTRHGVPAKELERQLGVTYKCAWRIAHELRKLMAVADDSDKLSGHVEVDETWIGGVRTREDARRRGDNKTVVMGLVERDGRIKAGPIDGARARILRGHVVANVEPGTMISTDEASAYKTLPQLGFQHGSVNHKKGEYARGIHHTNTLEGHWSLLKRSIRGTHVHVSPQHLWKYVCEFSYRRNNRHSHKAMFAGLVAAFSLPRLQDA